MGRLLVINIWISLSKIAKNIAACTSNGCSEVSPSSNVTRKPTQGRKCLKHYPEMIPNFVSYFSAYLIPLIHLVTTDFRAHAICRYIFLKIATEQKNFRCHSEISWITPLFYTFTNKRKVISSTKHSMRTSWFLASSSKINDCWQNAQKGDPTLGWRSTSGCPDVPSSSASRDLSMQKDGSSSCSSFFSQVLWDTQFRNIMFAFGEEPQPCKHPMHPIITATRCKPAHSKNLHISQQSACIFKMVNIQMCYLLSSDFTASESA